jgi:hypothetical protein
METHQRIAQRVLAEHSAIAGRPRVNPRPVLDYALGNVNAGRGSSLRTKDRPGRPSGRDC